MHEEKEDDSNSGEENSDEEGTIAPRYAAPTIND